MAIKKIVNIILLSSIGVFVASSYGATSKSETDMCSEFSRLLDYKNKTNKYPHRAPTKEEMSVIKNAKLEIMSYEKYGGNAVIIDIDNDDKDDVFVTSIQGSGRFVHGQIYEFVNNKKGVKAKLSKKESILNELGLLEEPFFIRVGGKNYLVSTDTGDNDGTRVSEVVKVADGTYKQKTLCETKKLIKAESQCKHPACVELVDTINDDQKNDDFKNITWPHRYFQPAGLSVFFPQENTNIDFDNTKNPTSVWRFGREDYAYQYIYWSLLGIGDNEPKVNPKLRNESEDIEKKSVLPAPQHQRLKRVLAQQSEALSKQLNKKVSLPNQGQFFFFKAHEGRTYWAWDLDQPAFGKNIHITYSNANTSDYIGTVNVKKTQKLMPCTSYCIYQDR